MNQKPFTFSRRLRNLKNHRPSKLKFRPMAFEELEERRVMSAVSPFQTAVSEPANGGAFFSEDLYASSAIFAPAVPAESQPLDLLQPQNTAELQLNPGTQESLDSAPSQLLAASGAVSAAISGIPPGDAGGLAGANGGGRLPLEIPGFQGMGNAYYLTDLGSLARVIWLYAEYFGNQKRTAPEMTILPRPQTSLSSTNSGIFGTKLGTSVYYDEIPREETEPKDSTPETESAKPRKPQFEYFIDQNLERTFQDLLNRREFLQKKRSPEKFELQVPQFPPDAPLPANPSEDFLPVPPSEFLPAEEPGRELDEPFDELPDFFGSNIFPLGIPFADRLQTVPKNSLDSLPLADRDFTPWNSNAAEASSSPKIPPQSVPLTAEPFQPPLWKILSGQTGSEPAPTLQVPKQLNLRDQIKAEQTQADASSALQIQTEPPDGQSNSESDLPKSASAQKSSENSAVNSAVNSAEKPAENSAVKPAEKPSGT